MFYYRRWAAGLYFRRACGCIQMHLKVAFTLWFCRGCLHFLVFKRFAGIRKSHSWWDLEWLSIEYALSLWFCSVGNQNSHLYCGAVVCSTFQAFRWHATIAFSLRFCRVVYIFCFSTVFLLALTNRIFAEVS